MIIVFFVLFHAVDYIDYRLIAHNEFVISCQTVRAISWTIRRFSESMRISIRRPNSEHLRCLGAPAAVYKAMSTA